MAGKDNLFTEISKLITLVVIVLLAGIILLIGYSFHVYMNQSSNETLEGFCGVSTYGQCTQDNDCITGGCSGQICQSKKESSVVTTCEWRDCYDASKYGLTCGCEKGKCQWSE